MTPEAVSRAYLTLYILGLLVAMASIVYRWLRYRRRQMPVPVLLPRDFFVLFGLFIPFVGVFVIRMMGEAARHHPLYLPWTVASGALAVVSIWVWVWYELFVIEGTAARWQDRIRQRFRRWR